MLTYLYRALAGATVAAFALGAQAQTYPIKSITLIVPFAPGASADAVARIVGREFGEALGQPVVVDNKVGAGGSLGMMIAAKQPPDAELELNPVKVMKQGAGCIVVNAVIVPLRTSDAA